MTHKTDFMRSQIRRQVFDNKQATKIGGDKLQPTSEENSVSTQNKKEKKDNEQMTMYHDVSGSQGYVATGLVSTSLQTAKLPDEKSTSQSIGGNSRQPSISMQQNKILNQLLGVKVQEKTKAQDTGANSTLAIGGGEAINLNMDLPVTSSSPDADIRQWNGFNNETRRLTTNQVPNRNQILGYNQSTNDKGVSSTNSIQIQQ